MNQPTNSIVRYFSASVWIWDVKCSPSVCRAVQQCPAHCRPAGLRCFPYQLSCRQQDGQTTAAHSALPAISHPGSLNTPSGHVQQQGNTWRGDAITCRTRAWHPGILKCKKPHIPSPETVRSWDFEALTARQKMPQAEVWPNQRPQDYQSPCPDFLGSEWCAEVPGHKQKCI